MSVAIAAVGNSDVIWDSCVAVISKQFLSVTSQWSAYLVYGCTTQQHTRSALPSTTDIS